MTFYIDFPVDWAGIPPVGEGQRWTTAEAWAQDIIDELAAGTGTRLKKSKRRVLEDIFAEHAVESDRRGASRTFLSLASWDGPLTSADAYMTSRAALGAISLEDYIGANDTEATEHPLLEPFTTQSGLAGFRCIRFLTPYDSLPTIVGVVEYGFEDNNEVLRLTTSQMDLETFSATIDLMDALAGSVTSA
jgi:hypothetical protein